MSTKRVCFQDVVDVREFSTLQSESECEDESETQTVDTQSRTLTSATTPSCRTAGIVVAWRSRQAMNFHFVIRPDADTTSQYLFDLSAVTRAFAPFTEAYDCFMLGRVTASSFTRLSQATDILLQQMVVPCVERLAAVRGDCVCQQLLALSETDLGTRSQEDIQKQWTHVLGRAQIAGLLAAYATSNAVLREAPVHADDPAILFARRLGVESFMLVHVIKQIWSLSSPLRGIRVAYEEYVYMTQRETRYTRMIVPAVLFVAERGASLSVPADEALSNLRGAWFLPTKTYVVQFDDPCSAASMRPTAALQALQSMERRVKVAEDVLLHLQTCCEPVFAVEPAARCEVARFDLEPFFTVVRSALARAGPKAAEDLIGLHVALSRGVGCVATRGVLPQCAASAIRDIADRTGSELGLSACLRVQHTPHTVMCVALLHECVRRECLDGVREVCLHLAALHAGDTSSEEMLTRAWEICVLKTRSVADYDPAAQQLRRTELGSHVRKAIGYLHALPGNATAARVTFDASRLRDFARSHAGLSLPYLQRHGYMLMSIIYHPQLLRFLSRGQLSTDDPNNLGMQYKRCLDARLNTQDETHVMFKVTHAVLERQVVERVLQDAFAYASSASETGQRNGAADTEGSTFEMSGRGVADTEELSLADGSTCVVTARGGIHCTVRKPSELALDLACMRALAVMTLDALGVRDANCASVGALSLLPTRERDCVVRCDQIMHMLACTFCLACLHVCNDPNGAHGQRMEDAGVLSTVKKVAVEMAASVGGADACRPEEMRVLLTRMARVNMGDRMKASAVTWLRLAIQHLKFHGSDSRRRIPLKTQTLVDAYNWRSMYVLHILYPHAFAFESVFAARWHDARARVHDVASHFEQSTSIMDVMSERRVSDMCTCMSERGLYVDAGVHAALHQCIRSTEAQSESKVLAVVSHARQRVALACGHAALLGQSSFVDLHNAFAQTQITTQRTSVVVVCDEDMPAFNDGFSMCFGADGVCAPWEALKAIADKRRTSFAWHVVPVSQFRTADCREYYLARKWHNVYVCIQDAACDADIRASIKSIVNKASGTTLAVVCDAHLLQMVRDGREADGLHPLSIVYTGTVQIFADRTGMCAAGVQRMATASEILPYCACATPRTRAHDLRECTVWNATNVRDTGAVARRLITLDGVIIPRAFATSIPERAARACRLDADAYGTWGAPHVLEQAISRALRRMALGEDRAAIVAQAEEEGGSANLFIAACLGRHVCADQKESSSWRAQDRNARQFEGCVFLLPVVASMLRRQELCLCADFPNLKTGSSVSLPLCVLREPALTSVFVVRSSHEADAIASLARSDDATGTLVLARYFVSTQRAHTVLEFERRSVGVVACTLVVEMNYADTGDDRESATGAVVVADRLPVALAPVGRIVLGNGVEFYQHTLDECLEVCVRATGACLCRDVILERCSPRATKPR